MKMRDVCGCGSSYEEAVHSCDNGRVLEVTVRVLARVLRRGAAAASLAGGLMALAGCQNFFVCDKASCTTSSSSTTSNYAFVSNSSSGGTYINGYALSSGALVAATSSPKLLSVAPSAMVVSESNTYLYVGSNSGVTGGAAAVYGYTIGTGGVLTALSSGNALVTTQVESMDVSPDGKWLFVLTINDGVNLPVVTEYAIASTGLLTLQQSQSFTGSTNGILTPLTIKVAPSGNYIALALGTGGVAVFPFNTTTGVIGTTESLISFTTSGVGANDLGIDSNNFLYIAATPGILVYSVSSAGTPSSSTVSSITSGLSVLNSLVVDGTSFVYAGNSGSNVIYGFSTTSAGVVTALSPASVSGPTLLSKLAVSTGGKYLLGVGYGATSGLQMFTIGSTGTLTSASTAATGTSSTVPAVLALTH